MESKSEFLDTRLEKSRQAEFDKFDAVGKAF